MYTLASSVLPHRCKITDVFCRFWILVRYWPGRTSSLQISLINPEEADGFSQGMKFEPSSFKLNHEMVALMGGRDSQGYKMFTELTVKAFLAIRPHADQLIDAVHLMLGTALPSFKGEGTITRLRNRFQLQLGERQAAEFMMGVIRNAHENMRSNVYDGFQKMQK